MKALAILLLSASLACGATVNGIVHDSSGHPITEQPTFTPLFNAYFDGTNTIFPVVLTPHVGTNGDFSTTLAAGPWSYAWSGQPTLYGLVPTNATVNFWTTVTNVFTNLVAQVSGHVLPGSNLTTTTNGLGTPTETVTLALASVLTLQTNSGPTLWTNPVVWLRWTNSAGGTYWSPGFTNGN